MALREHAIYRRLETPAGDAAQGGCYLTRDTGPCVDTGALIYGEGTLTISLTALRELAEVAGWSVNEEAAELEKRNAELERENEQLKAEIEDMRGTIDAVGVAVARAAAEARS